MAMDDMNSFFLFFKASCVQMYLWLFLCLPPGTGRTQESWRVTSYFFVLLSLSQTGIPHSTNHIKDIQTTKARPQKGLNIVKAGCVGYELSYLALFGVLWVVLSTRTCINSLFNSYCLSLSFFLLCFINYRMILFQFWIQNREGDNILTLSLVSHVS